MDRSIIGIIDDKFEELNKRKEDNEKIHERIKEKNKKDYDLVKKEHISLGQKAENNLSMMWKNKLFRESIEKIFKQPVAGGVRRGNLLIYEKLMRTGVASNKWGEYKIGIYVRLRLKEDMRLSLTETATKGPDREIFLEDIQDKETENDIREILKVLSDPAKTFDFFCP